MAYFRGENYIWSDGDDLHLWVREGLDQWNNVGWCFDENEQTYPNASGVAVPENFINQFVMMRLAEILVHSTPEQVEKLIDEACAVGNFGSDCLKRNIQTLKAVLMSLRLEEPERR